MGEKEPVVEPGDILRQARVEVVPYLRQLLHHRRAIIPRTEIAKRWINYYEKIAKTRPLKTPEIKKLGVHRQTLAVGNARRDLYSAAGKYARSKSAVDLATLRQAQSRYWEEKIETLPPEKREEERLKMVPPEEMYDELEHLKKDIKSKCKRYKAAKTPTRIMSFTQRYLEVKVVGELLREDYARMAEISQKGAKMSELVHHYREMKQAGAS